MASQMRLHGKWKEVKIDPNAFLEHDFSGFVCMQELTDYEIINNTVNRSSTSGKNKKKKKAKNTATSEVVSEQPDSKDDSERKTKRSVSRRTTLESSQVLESLCPTSEISQSVPSKKTTDKIVSDSAQHGDTSGIPGTLKKKRKGKKRHLDSSEGDAGVKVKKFKQEDSQNKKLFPDMSSWKDLHVPEQVLRALSDLNFTAPTPIQTLVLPSAIRDKKDIVGAAETGSGKTLAFGIPIINTILKLKHIQSRTSVEFNSDGEADTSDLDISFGSSESSDPKLSHMEEHNSGASSGDCDGNSSGDDIEGVSSQKPANQSKLPRKSSKGSSKKSRPLYALVLTPTRELAIQVRDHLQAAAKYTGIKVVAIVGGMAAAKQERLLQKRPEIVVATPGRLWELLQEGDPHLNKVSHVRSLVIDEADRMVEKGHFEELSKLLQVINKDEANSAHRQTFVFSATLTFVHAGPQRLKYKKRPIQMTEKQKLDELMAQVGVKPKPKLVDLTRAAGTAATLTEARINCTLEEKDLLLYYILNQYPGRTLVFANSKDCIRRLVSVFTLLRCCPLPLHADMHQRQRLKNLDRFKGNHRGLLLATDVAARGLDIPDVKHVIHYQVPRTTENYVHRSGRTARASKEGLSVMLVGPEDLQYYRKIIKSLNRDEDLPVFPIEQGLLTGVKARVNTARHIDKLEHSLSKQKKQNSWFEKTAKDMDIALDEDELLNDLGSSRDQSQLKRSLQHYREELSSLLTQPLDSHNSRGKYPTKSGRLHIQQNRAGAVTNAVWRVKSAQKLETRLKSKKRAKIQKKLKQSGKSQKS